MIIKIPLPEKVSTNDIYSGMHWSKRKKLADLYHQCLIEHRNKRIADYPIDVTFIFSFKGTALDCTNVSYMAKLLEDGMKAYKIITDDSPKFVQSVTLISQKGQRDEVEIILV